MSEPDGRIVIDTEIDDKGILEGIREISSKSIKLSNDIKKTEAQINSLEAAMKRMANTRLNQKEFDEMKLKANQAKMTLDSLYESAMRHEKSILIPGLSDSEMQKVYEQDKKWQDISQSIEKAERELEAYRERLSVLEADTRTQKDTPEYQIKSDKLNYAVAKLNELKQKQEEIPSSAERVGKAVREIGEAAKRGFNKCVNTLGRVRKAGVSLFRAITGHSNRSKKSVNKMNGGLFQSIFLMRKMAVTALFFQAFSKFTTAVGDSISTLILKDKALAKGLAQVKANFATAFTPIWNVALPYIKALVSWLSIATAKLGGFLSALTGASATSMEGSVGETADNMEKLAKSTEKANRQLNSYDKLNVRNKKDKDKDEKDGVTASGVTAGNWDGLVKRLKDSWRRQNFAWFGKLLAEKINKSMANIPWKEIKRNAKKIAKCIGTFFNGFIGKLNWKLIGRTMAEGLNTAILFLNTLLTTLKWRKLGWGIADSMNSFLRRTNWKGTGRVIRNCLNAVFSLSSTWSKKFKFKLLGTSLAQAVNSAISGIKWKSALTAATNFGKGIANTANSFIHETDFKKLGKTVADFIKIGVNGWYANVTTFNFKQLGKKIGDSINGFFKEMNKVDDKSGLSGWKKLGKSITNSIGGIVDTITYALETVDWEEVGTSIGTFLAELDWLGLLGKVAKAVWEALNGALKAWKSWFNAEPVGASIVAGLLAVITISKFIKVANAIAGIFGDREFEGLAVTGIRKLTEKLGKTFGKKVAAEVASDTVANDISGGISASLSTAGKSSKLVSACASIGSVIGAGIIAAISIAWAHQQWKEVFDNYSGTEVYEAGKKMMEDGNFLGGAATGLGTLLSGKYSALEWANGIQEWWEDQWASDTDVKNLDTNVEAVKKRISEFGKHYNPVSGKTTFDSEEYQQKKTEYLNNLKTENPKLYKSYVEYEKREKELSKSTKKLSLSFKLFGNSTKTAETRIKTLKDQVRNGSISLSAYNKLVKKTYRSNKEWTSAVRDARLATKYANGDVDKFNKTGGNLSKTLKDLGVKTSSAKNAVYVLKGKLDDGTISFEKYKEICGKSYKSTEELYCALDRVAGKKVTAEVKAAVNGKKDVDDLSYSITNLSGKSIKVIVDADTATFQTKIKNLTTGKKVKVSLTVNKNEFSKKVKEALSGTDFQMKVGQIFPSEKQISEYFKKVLKSDSWKAATKIPTTMGMNGRTLKIDDKKKTVRIPSEMDITGSIGMMYKTAGYKVSYYEKGGFPKLGQLFFARENGIPEFVGRKGNRTAVANNDQIVESISGGVYRAMKSIMTTASNFEIPNIPKELDTVMAKYTAFNSSYMTSYVNRVPACATGTVIPSNKTFISANGGQSTIRTEKSMEDAVFNAMKKAGIGDTQNIVINMDGKEVYKVVVNRDKQHKAQYGKSGMAVE